MTDESHYSYEIDVDSVIEEMSLKRERESARETVARPPTEDESKSLLQLNHDNKAMKAQVQQLQEQVKRLEEGGDYEEPLKDAKSIDGVPCFVPLRDQAAPDDAGYLTDDTDRKSAVKSVTFSDYDETTDEEEELRKSSAIRGSRRNRQGSRGSTVGSRASTVGSRASTRASKSIVDLEDHDTLDQHLSEDTFGFLLATPTCSTPFGIALLVLVFQVSIYTLMMLNLLNVEAKGDNLFSVPGNVTEAVWVAQIIAIVIAVVTQDDIRTGLDMLREGYSADMRAAFPHSNTWKFSLSVSTRLVEGAMGLIVNFLLIVTSETVIDLLLNFTALAFVSQLDEASFFLSKQGFAGKACLEHSTLISEAHYAVPKTMVMARKTAMMVIILVAMMVAWGYVRYKQSDGAYLCSTLLVQMGDDMRPELGTLSGLYDMENPNTVGFISQHVMYVDREAGNTRFAYCEAQQYWTLQYRASADAPFPSDGCDQWKVRSAQTNTFEITKAATDVAWFVRDDFHREVLLEPFYLHCYECGKTFDVNTATNECSSRGTCSDAVCDCDEGWYGLRCEFREPCPALSLDTRATGTLLVSNDVAHHLGEEGFELLVDPSADSPTMIEAYNRPIYVAHLLHGHHMIIFYAGRRWATTHTGLLPQASLVRMVGSLTPEQGLEAVRQFFKQFHGHWSSFAIEFITEPMDFGTPDDASSPIGLLWYEAEPTSHINQTEIQAPNQARPSAVRLLCASCDDQYNPCHFNGICNSGTCECPVGAKGDLCESSPVGNGKCDEFFNVPYFELDGGDCCPSTCVSSPEYTCGEESNGYTNQGYPNCQLPPDRWQLLHDNHIVGDPLSLAGYAVAMSQAGTLLAVGEPEQSRVKLFDKDGSLWILRETLEGVPDSHFGISVSISGGPVHWRNNPNFRAPLILAIGVAPKKEPRQIFVYSCGNDVSCSLKDTLVNVSGQVGPEAFDISNDGRVVAYGAADSGSVEVYEMTADYYEGERAPRETLHPAGNATGATVWVVRLSEHGDVIAVFETMPLPRTNALRVYDWDGEFYHPRGEALLETDAKILQRQIAVSDDGSTVVVGLSKCPNLDIKVFKWDADSSSWISRGSPPMREEEACNDKYLAWSVATDHHGYTVVAGAYPDSDVVTAYEWVDSAWNILGDPIEGHYPGSETATALSSDGAHMVIGIPHGGLNEAGLVSTYSLPYSHCPPGEAHHFRLSLTTDYEPQNTLWSLEDVGTAEMILTGGPYPFQVATLVEEICLDTVVCHAFSIYNLNGAHGLDRPGRFDLFLDGEDLDRDSFSGRAKRVSVGEECLTCPEDKRLLRMMVQTCHSADWTLADDAGVTVVAGGTNKTCEDRDAIENFYWEETCIEEARCYTFTVTDTTPEEQQSSGAEYLMLYDDDVPLASESGIMTSAMGVAGACGDL